MERDQITFMNIPKNIRRHKGHEGLTGWDGPAVLPRAQKNQPPTITHPSASRDSRLALTSLFFVQARYTLALQTFTNLYPYAHILSNTLVVVV